MVPENMYYLFGFIYGKPFTASGASFITGRVQEVFGVPGLREKTKGGIL
jgi:hypothetical protein